MKVKLTQKEFQLLSSGSSLPAYLKEKVLPSPQQKGGHYILHLSDDVADQIRDWCADELQREGFDENYDLTEIGRVLESLVDKMQI